MSPFKKYMAAFYIFSLTCCAIGVEYFVSADGNDSNPGSQEKPFATLVRARDEIRRLKSTLPILPAGATVYIRKGLYVMDSSFTLTGQDGGVADAPVIYTAYNKECVRITGGHLIKSSYFTPVLETDYAERIPDEKARRNVMVVDLKKIGITDFGVVKGSSNQKAELILDNQYMQLARYPNNKWLHIEEVPQLDEVMNEGRNDWLIEGVPRGRHCGYFIYPGDRPTAWIDRDEIYMHGYWVYDWFDELMKIERLDTENKCIFPAKPHSRYGYQKNARFYFVNVLEEIDTPGEWYLDRRRGTLLFWLPPEQAKKELFFPVMSEPLFVLNDTTYIKVERIHFECSRAEAVKIINGSNNEINGCKFANLGDPAIRINGGVSNGIRSCDIYETSGTGLKISGGDRKTLLPCFNFAINNHIHHFARIYRTYRPAVHANGVGIRIAHNYIHDAPHEGLELQGNDLVVEFNEITQVCRETEDVGAIYCYADWSYCGNIIRQNYFHNIHGDGKYVDSRAVYLDLPVGGILLYGNIFYDVDTAFFTNSGRSSIVTNNIFVKCNPSVFINVYREPKEFSLGGDWKLVEKLQEIEYRNTPYRERYPWLAKVLSEGDDPAIPYGNVIIKNVSCGGKFLSLHAELDLSILQIRDNYIADPLLCNWRAIFQEQTEGDVTYKYGDDQMMSQLRSYGNIIEDPNQTIDLTTSGFRLPAGSPALEQGFQQIPFDRIGIQKDNYRIEVSK